MADIYDTSTYGYPDQAASDEEKASRKYGNQVANYISNEWFYKDAGVARFYDNREEMERLRLYARGTQNTAKYKRELAVDGDLSYLNLDWEPVPVIPKFVDLIVNGIQDRLWDFNAYAQDEIATNKRKRDLKILRSEMEKKEQLMDIKNRTGVDVFENDPEGLPENMDELEVFTQLNYKQQVEIACETTINQVFDQNRYDEVRKRISRDITELGIATAKHSFDPSKGVVIEYVDPANVIHSYTEDPNFADMYYHGEVKRIGIAELLQMFPDMSPETVRKVRQAGANHFDYHGIGYEQVQTDRDERREANKAEILFFSWKTVRRNIHKIRENRKGGETAVKRDETFEGPKTADAMFQKVERSEEIIYSGIKVLGDDDLLLKWELEKNMVRPKSSTAEVVMPMVIAAPNFHKGRHDSMVKRITKYADMIQLTYLKIQQVIQKLTPPGIGINADALAEIDLGNGTLYSPREALNMFFQTGSVIYRSVTSEGDPNRDAIPIQELPGSQGVQLQTLIQSQAYWYDQIRLATGINEARDASDPDPRALVGVQKLLSANSNTATRHILDAQLLITKKLAESVTIRMQDVLEFHPLKENFKMSIGKVNTSIIDSLDDLHIHDFGIFLELEPDEEERQFKEQNIQQALASQLIHLDDAIDVRNIKNTKLANQVLKLRRKKKHKEDLEMQAQQAQAQGEAQQQVAQAQSQAKQQELQMESQLKIQTEQAIAQMKIQQLQAEKEYEKEILMLKQQLELQTLQATQAQETSENAKDRAQGGSGSEGAGGDLGLGTKANTVDGKVKGRGYLQQ